MKLSEIKDRISKTLFLSYRESEYTHDSWDLRDAPNQWGWEEQDRNRFREAVESLSDDGVLKIQATMEPVVSLTTYGKELGEKLLDSSDHARENIFGVLLTTSQEEQDFELWSTEPELVGTPISVLFADIDNVESLSEKYTKSVVDETILTQVQRLVHKLATNRGHAYKHSTKEFVIILPNHSKAEADLWAERLRCEIELAPFDIDGSQETVTLSIGVAEGPEDGVDFEQLLNAAKRDKHPSTKRG